MAFPSAASGLLFVVLGLLAYGAAMAWLSFRRKADVPHALWLAVVLLAGAGTWSALYGGLVGSFLFQYRLVLSFVPLAMFLGYVAWRDPLFFQTLRKPSSNDFLRYYVSPSVVSQLEEKGFIRLGGSHRDVTVLFTDVRNSTGLCVSHPPELVLRAFNRYFDMVMSAVNRHGGTVDEITGDGIMAVFNAPRDLDDHPWRAFQAAAEIQRNMPGLNHELESLGLPVLNTGVGMDSGVGIAGHIGSRHFVRYTVLGDVTNTAARLQEFSRNGQVAMSAACFRRLSDRIQGSAQTVQVKGKGPTMIYRVSIE